MKYGALILVCLLFSFEKVAAQGWQWQHDLLTNSDENFNALACDNDGNVFVAVQFNNLFQVGQYSFQTNPIEDVCVVKYDSLGNVLWAQAFGGLYSDQINALACDSAGNVFVVGHFTAELFYFNTSIVGSTGRDIFIMRINADGSFGWIQTGSNIWDEEATDLVVTSQGDIVVSGMANNTSLIAGMELISDLPNVFMQEFIAKFSNEGTPLWIRSAGGTDYTSTAYSQSCLALGPDDSIHLGIPRSGGLNFAGQELTGPAANNTVILKWDSDGNPIWGWVGLSDGNDFLQDIAVDNQGRVYSVISTVMSSSFGGQSYTVVPGEWGMVFIRLMPDGIEDRFWIATGARKSDVYALVHTSDNRIWFGGMQRYITYFPFGTITAGTVDDRQGFVCALNTYSDQFEQFNRVYGDGWQYILGGCTNDNGNLYFGGDISGSVGAPVYFGLQNELTNDMYIEGKTLPFVARYNTFGCSNNQEIIIPEIVSICEGASVELSPDIPSYAYQWSDGTTHSLNVSASGVYPIQAILSEGCIARDTVAVSIEIAPQLNWILQTVSCAGENDGAISMDATGSNPPYTFTWNGNPVVSPVNGIGQGLYLLQAESAGGCATTAEIEMTEPEPLTVEYSMNYDEQTEQGSIVVESIDGGTPPYIVYWPDFPQAADSLSGVGLGSYDLLISDANGCEQIFNLTLTTSIEYEKNAGIECYPMPATDYVTLSAQGNFSWKLLDAAGQILRSDNRLNSQHRVYLTSAAPGFYIFQLTMEGGLEYSLKVVKQ